MSLKVRKCMNPLLLKLILTLLGSKFLQYKGVED